MTQAAKYDDVIAWLKYNVPPSQLVELANNLYKGTTEHEAVKAAYKANTGNDLPTPTTTPATDNATIRRTASAVSLLIDGAIHHSGDDSWAFLEVLLANIARTLDDWGENIPTWNNLVRYNEAEKALELIPAVFDELVSELQSMFDDQRPCGDVIRELLTKYDLMP